MVALLWSLSTTVFAQPIPVEVEEEAEVAPSARPSPARVQRAVPEPEREEASPPAEPSAAPPEAEVMAPASSADAVVPVQAPAAARTAAVKPSVAAAPEGLARNIVHVTEDESAIVERWRRRAELLSARDSKRGDEQLAEIERMREALAFENMFGVAAALVREADRLRQAGQGDEALARCQAAVRLAPGFDAAHLCVVRALLSASPASVGEILASLRSAVSATFSDLRSSRNTTTDEALTAVFALAIACAMLVVLLILRYAGLFFHDFHHLFPRGVSKWQSFVVATVLVALPVLLGFGALGTLVAAAAAVSLFLSRGEAVALAVSFALLAAAQFVVGAVVKAGAFGPAAHDVYVVERADAPLAAVRRVEQRMADGRGDSSSAFALGRYYKRIGRYAQAAEHYQKALALKPNWAAALNNLGNVRFLQGDTAAAIELYRSANTASPALAQPLHNVAKMYFREGKLVQGEEAQKKAVELGGDLVRDRVGVQDDTRANLYVLDMHLPDEAIEAIADRESEFVRGLGGPAMRLVVGWATPDLAALLAFVPVLLVGLALGVQRRLRPSTRCDKCGRAVCTRCDPDLGSTSGMCGQCISVFVRRSGVDAPDRIRKEIEVRRFRRRQRLIVRFVGLLVGGGGHVLAGRILGGALFLVVFALLASQVVFWNGFVNPPVATGTVFSPVRIALYALGFLLVYVASFRHLVRGEEGE